MELKSNGKWNDERRSTSKPFVLEVEASCNTAIRSEGSTSGSLFPIGSHLIQFAASDASGNATSCSFNVNLSDGAAPTVICPIYDQYPIYLGPSCSLLFPDLRDTVTVSDCSSWTNTMSPSPGTEFVRDTVLLMTMDVQDVHGNHRNNDHWIHVVDTIGPTFTCPAAITLLAPICTASLPDLSALITDAADCTGPITITQSIAAGSSLSGAQNVIIEVRDGRGNARRCTVAVSVQFQDTDGDGTPDCSDACPNDINKTEPGSCGCGIAEGSCQDCAGVAFGTALLDNCGTCVGGNTGLTACVADCNGEFGGNAILDNCGTCVGGNTGLTACVADCNGEFGGSATLDNCGTCTGGNTALTACMSDCNGVFGGNAFIDNCGTCVGENTGLEACIADCNGEFGGTALPGSPCDDGQSSTTNDIWDTNCTCSGQVIMCSNDAGPNQSVCGLIATMAADGSGIWSTEAEIQFDDLSSPIATVSASVPGIYTLIWTTIYENCIATDTVSLSFLSPSDAAFSYAQDSYCLNSMPPVPWTAMPNGSFAATPAGLALNPESGEIDLDQSLPGNYSITHTIAGACPTSSSQNIVIDSPVDASWEAPTSVCSNADAMQLTLLASGTSNGTWSGPGVSGSFFQPSTGMGAVTIVHSVSNGACSESSEQMLTVQDAPLADAGPDSEVCGLEYELQATATSASGIWTAPTSITFLSDASEPTARIASSSVGSYQLTWTVSEGSCSASDRVRITFLEAGHVIHVDAGPDQRLALRNRTMLMGNATTGAELSWSIAEGSGYLHAPHAASTEVEGLVTGINVFILSATIGKCSQAQDTVIVQVDDFFIPEGFSPNGDGVNDRFEITGIDMFPGSHLQVHDRAGQKIYDHPNYDNSWDGRSINGTPLSDGTYFYVLNMGSGRSYNGTIILKH